MLILKAISISRCNVVNFNSLSRMFGQTKYFKIQVLRYAFHCSFYSFSSWRMDILYLITTLD